MKSVLVYLKKYKVEAVLAPLFKMTEAVFELLVPLVVKDIIDVGIKNMDTRYIVMKFLLLIGFAIVGFISSITAQYFSAKVATSYSRDVKRELFSHIESLSFEDLDSIGTSTLLTRMTSDINQLQSGVNMFLRLFLRSPFVVFGALVMAFIVDVKLALIFAVTIPLLFLVVILIMRKTLPLFKKVQAKLDRLLKKTKENIDGVRVIRAFNKEKNEKNEFISENEDYTKFQIFVNKISSLMNPITYFIINFAIIAIIYFGSREVNEGLLLKGDIVAEYNYMSQILVELIKLANLTVLLTKAIASSKRITEMFNITSSQEYKDETATHERNDVAIKMENVSIMYKGNSNNSLSNISFELKKGMTLGVIGGTGSGKSTLINLIPRYYDVTEGKVSLFGLDVKDYSKSDIRKMVGVVSQKTVLFKGTIKDNLTFSNPGKITDEEIEKALIMSQAKDVVLSKKDGLNEEVKEGGTNFSGGQRQRLSIARTLLQKPEILILDDSSSALDYLTDFNLRKAIREIDGMTIVITSQRASSVMDSDLIIVLDEGRIAAMGKHDELISSSPIYKEIYDSQFEKEGE